MRSRNQKQLPVATFAVCSGLFCTARLTHGPAFVKPAKPGAAPVVQKPAQSTKVALSAGTAAAAATDAPPLVEPIIVDSDDETEDKSYRPPKMSKKATVTDITDSDDEKVVSHCEVLSALDLSVTSYAGKRQGRQCRT